MVKAAGAASMPAHADAPGLAGANALANARPTQTMVDHDTRCARPAKKTCGLVPPCSANAPSADSSSRAKPTTAASHATVNS